ncbi:MAG: GumC family protein, partial [Gemmatimonadales bacterium]
MKSSDASGYGSLLTSEREIHLKDLLFVVFHHWKIAAVFPVLVAGGAYLSGRNFVTQYRSHLTVQVSSPKQVFARLDDIDVDELALRTDPILSEALVLTTQTLARRVVEAPQTQLQLHLVDPRDHRGAIMGSVEVDRGAPLQGFTESYELTRRPTGWELRDATTGRVADFGTYADRAEGPGFRFRPIQLTPTQSEERTLFQILPWQMAASFVTGGISYSVREATTAVDISFTGTDPTLVPRILNQAAVELRQMGVDRALASAERRGNYIDQELARYDSLHSAKMSELQALRETEQITDLSAEETAIISSIATSEEARHELLAFISTLRAAVGEEETIGIEALNRLSAIPETANNSALAFQISSILNLYNERRELTAGTLGLSNSNPRVQALDQRILDGHRELRNAVTAALQSAQTRLETIEDRIAARRSQLATIPGKATQVAEIQLEAEILNQTLEYLLGQQQIARMQSATIGPYIQILDGASPPAPIGTSRNQKILLGFLVGVLLGIGAAFFLEYLDQTIKTSADIERILRVPVLGIIPDDPRLSTKTNRREGIRVISSLDPDDQRAEAFRSLRTNVTLVGAERARQVVGITSPRPGEG